MEDKIIKSLFNYAKKDKVNNMSLAYFNLEKGIIIKENYSCSNNDSNFISNNDTLYEIGSITKLFTALVFGLMHSQKKIDINTSVKYFFGENASPVFDKITIKDLITHASGLPRLPTTFLSKMENETDPYYDLIKSDLYDYLISPTEISANKDYKYSNLGYGILGEILSLIHKKPYVQVIKENVLIPLNMTKTDVLDNYIDLDNIATGYNHSNKKTNFWTNEILSGAGCFLSNINDMTSFLINHFDENKSVQFSLAKITDIVLSKNISYAWHIKNGMLSKLLRYSGYYWHNGMTGGFASFVCFNKKKKIGLVILANKPILLDSYFYRFSSYF